ncbi:MAG: alanine--glyoxylate aminotransferase family protein [Candidatus Omnitrophica bacterium]|nr:alanine--glyoxylate aminotransferase family protein [Candidatus Omnitrophota bacterium]MBU1853783.1 alanine--glyoxylate aminotransferase family protein [Candidatus Omnitrophota bacterium]
MKNYLLTPGPTPVPKEVLDAMARPIIHHRTPQFQTILKEVEADLKHVFQTKNNVLIFSSSGTGAMEGTVTNLLSPGDKAIVVRAGKFGERWGELCDAYGIEFIPIDVEWGKAVDPEVIKKILTEKGTLPPQKLAGPPMAEIKAVFTTLCETSTGVSIDIEAIGKIVKPSNAVLVVDAISALGAVPIKTDEWGIDVCVAGSQKGLMIPPGLSFVSLSQKALEMVSSSKLPKYYFSFSAHKKSIEKDDTPYTPAVNLIIGLNEALKVFKKDGLENVLSKHKKNAQGVRNAMKALKLELFAPDAYSDAVTAVKVPEGIDGGKLVKTMRDKYGVAIAGGQAQLKGKIFRIATMGHITPSDLKVCIDTLETVLSDMGYKFEKGVGVKAFEKTL